MGRRNPPATILPAFGATVTPSDIDRLVNALNAHTEAVNEANELARGDNALRRYTFAELASLTKTPITQIERLVAAFHLEVLGGKRGRGHKATVSRRDAEWLVLRMARGGIDELMLRDDQRARRRLQESEPHVSSGESHARGDISSSEAKAR